MGAELGSSNEQREALRIGWGKMAASETQADWSIISLREFIQATRDSGYKGTASAISELVDNSLQAGAKRIDVFIEVTGDATYPLSIAVRDDGSGMAALALRQSLRFGGSTRFDNRAGLGRYGMGLPNASLSQARCVTVFSWQSASTNGRRPYLLHLPGPRQDFGRRNARGPPSAATQQCPHALRWRFGNARRLVAL